MNTPKINAVPAVPADNNYLKKQKKYIEIIDDDFEIGENLKRLIEKTMIEILEKYYAIELSCMNNKNMHDKGEEE